MVRPHKAGLDYFPLDVDMDSDSAIQYIEARHGIAGFAIVVKLMMRVYREGYFLMWSERERFVFSRHIGADANLVDAVVKDCIAEGLFDPETFAAHGVLTSRGIQRRYMEATKRRAGTTMCSEYIADYDTVVCYPHIALVSVCRNRVNVNSELTESTQRKVKESKGEERTSSDDDSPQSVSHFHALLKVYERLTASCASEATKRTIRAWAEVGYSESGAEAAIQAAIDNKAGGIAKYATAILKRGPVEESVQPTVDPKEFDW